MRTVPHPSMWLAAVPGLALLLAGIPYSAAHAERTAVVVSTSSINGETISCGCKKKDLGGIAKRATVFREVRAASPSAIMVDAGGFGSQADFEPWMRTRFQWEMMTKLNYDVVTPGASELIKGIQPLKELLATGSGVQVVSANVTDKAGNLLWPASTVVERGGIKYGITGITDGSYYSMNLSRGKAEIDEFSFNDMEASLAAVLPELRGKSDVVVVLLHTGAIDAKRIVEKTDGIDVAVVGHNPGYKFVPETVGNTLMIRAGNRGQYVNVLELTLDDRNEIADHLGEARPLGDAVKNDSVFGSLVSQFNAKYDALKEESGHEDEVHQISPQ